MSNLVSKDPHNKKSPHNVYAASRSGVYARREMILAIAAGGLCVALATGLSYLKLFSMPNSGSVTAGSMLPLIFYALAFGPGWGISAGVAYGVLQLILDPYVVHWAQLLLDYPIAFGLLGLAGFFAAGRTIRFQQHQVLRRLSLIPMTRIMPAAGAAILARFLAHFLSGIIFFAEYAGDQSVILYSLIYNGLYLVPEMVIVAALLFVLRSLFQVKSDATNGAGVR